MSAWTYRSSDGKAARKFACPLGPTVRLTARPPERSFRLVLESHDGRAPGADSEEKHEPVSDIDTVVVDSLKALDPEWPIREADIDRHGWHVRKVPGPDMLLAACHSAPRGNPVFLRQRRGLLGVAERVERSRRLGL